MCRTKAELNESRSNVMGMDMIIIIFNQQVLDYIVGTINDFQIHFILSGNSRLKGKFSSGTTF